MENSSESDATLWQRARAGDEVAFGDLYERHVQRVYNYCFRRLGSWSVAEDATQLVFMQTWLKQDALVIEQSMLPFLFAVANNVVRNSSRSARRYATAIAAVPSRELVDDHADDVAQRIDDERQMQQMLRAIRKLRRHDRDVVAMCDWEGLSYVDVARALDVPVGTVKSRLSRARHRLRELLVDIDPLEDPVVAPDRLAAERAPAEPESELP